GGVESRLLASVRTERRIAVDMDGWGGCGNYRSRRLLRLVDVPKLFETLHVSFLFGFLTNLFRGEDGAGSLWGARSSVKNVGECVRAYRLKNPHVGSGAGLAAVLAAVLVCIAESERVVVRFGPDVGIEFIWFIRRFLLIGIKQMLVIPFHHRCWFLRVVVLVGFAVLRILVGIVGAHHFFRRHEDPVFA